MAKIAKRPLEGVASVIGGIIIHLTFGNMYSFSNVMTYTVSYMNQRVSSSITYSNFVWINSVAGGAQGFFMISGGLLERRVGPKLVILTGSTLFSAGVMATFFSIDSSLIGVIATYGLLAGLGIAVGYATPLACATRWFPARKGLINGLIVGGFGMGALFSTNIQTFFLNPDNISPNDDGFFTDNSILDKVPTMFFLLGGVFIVMGYIATMLISSPPKNEDNDKLILGDEDKDSEDNLPSIQSSSLFPVQGPKQIIKGKLFYVLWFIYLFNSIGIVYVSSMNKAFGQTFIKDDHFLATVVSLSALFNASGRILWGTVMDKTSFKTALRMMSTILAILLCTLPFTSHMGKPGFACWVFMIYLTFSGTFALMPTAILKAFGSKHFPSNYGLLFTCQAVSGTAMAALNEVLLDAVGFTGSFITMGCIVFLAVLTSLFVPNGL